jgi:hypothetical protein
MGLLLGGIAVLIILAVASSVSDANGPARPDVAGRLLTDTQVVAEITRRSNGAIKPTGFGRTTDKATYGYPETLVIIVPATTDIDPAINIVRDVEAMYRQPVAVRCGTTFRVVGP